MAQKPPEGPAASKVTDEAITVRAEIDLDSFYQRLLNETRRLMADYGQQGLTGQDLADAVETGLRDLSDTPTEQAARSATTEGFNLGRNIAAQRNVDVIQKVTRTEILDDATCDFCESIDGTTYDVNTPAYFENMPPNGCAGRAMCRGFYMYEAA